MRHGRSTHASATQDLFYSDRPVRQNWNIRIQVGSREGYTFQVLGGNLRVGIFVPPDVLYEVVSSTVQLVSDILVLDRGHYMVDTFHRQNDLLGELEFFG